MKKFQYKRDSFNDGVILNEYLQENGQEGWELISVVAEKTEESFLLHVFLKKEIN